MTRASLLSIVLSWPAPELNPNSRAHWRVKAKAAKWYRAEGFGEAYKARPAFALLDHGRRFDLWLTFYPPNRRRRDDDNLVAAFKPARDGIAGALNVDDRRFRLHVEIADEIRKGGAVAVEITSEEI